MKTALAARHEIPWWALPVSIALFGSSCSLLSRAQAGPDHLGIAMVVIGAAVSFLFGLILYRHMPDIDPALIGELVIAAAALVVVAVISFAVVGDTASFAFIHILLTLGMACQLASWVMLARRTRERGAGDTAALGAGLALCICAPVITEIASRLLSITGVESQACLSIGMALAAVTAFLSTVLCLPDYITARREMPENDQQLYNRDLSDADELKIARAGTAYRLTLRERDVLAQLIEGHTLSQSASKLNVTVGTIKTHISHLYCKLGVSSREAAVEKVLGIDDEGSCHQV